MQATTFRTWLLAVTAMCVTGCGYTTLPLQSSLSGNYNYSSGGVVQQNLAPVFPPGVSAKTLNIDPATSNGRVGLSQRFNVAITGTDGKIYTDPRLVVWTLSNPELGVVDQTGVLNPQAAGTLKVQAQVGNLTASATVQIAEAIFAWQQLQGPSPSNLRAVKMVSASEAWAGGDSGTLMRFINNSWHQEPTFTTRDATVRGLGFANSNVGWAVGSRGTSTFISHWNGSGWIQDSLPVASGEVDAISVVSSNNAWACGQDGDGKAMILHFDGSSWKELQSPGKGKLEGIQMVSAQSGWAVGKDDGLLALDQPLIVKFSNGSWSKKGLWSNYGSFSLKGPQELTGIKMVSETQGYAVGIQHVPFVKDEGVFLTYDPQHDGWKSGTYDSSNPDLDLVPLHAIDMISGSEGWALGEVATAPIVIQGSNTKSIFGNLLDNQGGVLKADTSYFTGNLSAAFYAIDLMPTGEGFVVGQNGYILQRTYDWRGGSTTYSSTTSTGTAASGPSQNVPTTYGPGGTAAPTTASTTVGGVPTVAY